MGIMKKLSLGLPRNSLLTIEELFVRPNLDYVDIILDKLLTESQSHRIQLYDMI